MGMKDLDLLPNHDVFSAQGEVRVPHSAHDAGAAEGRGERQELLLRLAGRNG